MADFSATEAALEGFRVTRERPRAVGTWVLVYLALTLAVAALFLGVFGASFAALGAAQDDPEEAAAAMLGLAPTMLLIVPVVLAGLSVLVAAMYRAVLFPEESRRGYLRLGADEWRVFLTFLVLLGVYMVVVTVAAIVIAVLAAVAGSSRGPATLAGVIGMFALVFWVFTRLSLLSPLAVAEKRVDVRRAWAMTRGRFWPLLGAYLLAVMFAIIVAVFSTIISVALLAMLGGGVGALSQINNPDFSDFTPGLAIGFAAYLIVQAIAAVLQLVLTAVPPAKAYAQIAGDSNRVDAVA